MAIPNRFKSTAYERMMAISMAEQPDDDLMREVFARFGVAYYQSECLHRGLCMLLAWSGLPPRNMITRPRVEERLAKAFSLTLGDVAAKLKDVLCADLNSEVQTAVESRNFLAHHFWFERAHLLIRADDVHQLIAELDAYTEMFHRLDSVVSEQAEPMLREIGLTDELLQDSLKCVLAKETDEPLPDRQAIKELQKKLGRRQRLVRVWEFTLDDGQKPLIFELSDESRWQLSDVGLASTRYLKVGTDWKEHATIMQHLPADIMPRPKSIAPWNYEFTLSRGVVLWVKPGGPEHTFKWGLRLPSVDRREVN